MLNCGENDALRRFIPNRWQYVVTVSFNKTSWENAIGEIYFCISIMDNILHVEGNEILHVKLWVWAVDMKF
jgi:hypothetical protein